MYIPGFTSHLQSQFTGPVPGMSVMGAQQPAQQPAASSVPFRTIPIPANELGQPAPAYGNPNTSGFGETFDENLLQYMAIGPENDPFYVGMRGGTIGLDPRTNRANSAGFVPLTPGSQYQLINNATGEVVSAGAGEQGFRDVITQAQALSADGGKKANWAIMAAGPDGQFRQVSADTPDRGFLGTIADIALPALGAIALPGVGGFLGGALGSGLGAAGGSAISSVAQGRSLQDTLLRAGLSGVGAGVGASALGSPLTGASNAASASGAGAAAGQLGSQVAAAPFRDATGALVLSGIAGGGSGLTGATLGGAAAGALSNFASMPAGRGADLADRVFQQSDTPTPEPFRDPVTGDLVLTGTSTTPPLAPSTSTGGVLPVVAAGTAGSVFNAVNPDDNVIEVEKARQKAREGEKLTPADLDLILDSGTGTPQDLADKGITDEGEVKKSLGDRLKDLSLADYLKIAGLGLGLLGGAGGGQGNRGVIPAGLGSGVNPVFSGGLPRPTLPGASTGFAPRDPATLRPQTAQDWYRYGYGPEQSFFNYVPQGQPNTSRAFTGYAEGGDVVGGLGMATESFVVNGPGTGRSDEIPAMLSDGEYVIDAETVALLGDGSSKAGADILDQFRVNVRKDKGRKLARGEFSADAKRPEQYLKGGRA